MNEKPIETAEAARMTDVSVISGEVATLANTAGRDIVACMSIGCTLLSNVQTLTEAVVGTALMLLVRPPIWH